MDIVTRQKLNLLIQLAKADKYFAHEEKALIKGIASKHGFPESELKKLFAVPETIESLGALSPDKKKEYLLDCIALIVADGKIEPEEVTFAQNIALKLGFHKDVINYLLDSWDKADQYDLRPWKV